MERVSPHSPWQALDNNWVNVSAVSCRWDSLAEPVKKPDWLQLPPRGRWPIVDRDTYDEIDYRYTFPSSYGPEFEGRVVMRGCRDALIAKYRRGSRMVGVGLAFEIAYRYIRRLVLKNVSVIPIDNEYNEIHEFYRHLKVTLQSKYDGHSSTWDAFFKLSQLIDRLESEGLIEVDRPLPEYLEYNLKSAPNAFINGRLFRVSEQQSKAIANITKVIDHLDGLGTP